MMAANFIFKCRFISCLVLCGMVLGQDTMPLPWTRELEEGESGSDVQIMQALLLRSPGVTSSLEADGNFGSSTQVAVESFQTYTALNASGVFDVPTAQALLSCCERDGYRDNGTAASAYGKLYKIIVPLPSMNRSVETNATLLDKDNNFIRSFTVRTHGHRDDGSAMPWPDFGDGDYGLNELSSNGNTPTGLATIDLNSPEPEEVVSEYGPYPINRVVQGLEGNAGLLLSSIRSGILLHTGQWPGWESGEPMPNSDGCLHAWPEEVEAIWKDLVNLGVTVNENPYSSVNYPYETQGMISIYLEDR